MNANAVRLQRGSRRSRGFGLLEAIVAIVILGTSGLALFAWLNQNLSTATRVKDAEERARLQMEAVSLLANLNPAAAPEGDQVAAGMRVHWSSTLTEPMRNETGLGVEFIPRWQLGLYRVDIQARSENGRAEVAWQQLMVGWRPTPAFQGPVEAPAARP